MSKPRKFFLKIQSTPGPKISIALLYRLDTLGKHRKPLGVGLNLSRIFRLIYGYLCYLYRLKLAWTLRTSKDCTGQGANLGPFGFRLFFTQVAPKTTRLPI